MTDAEMTKMELNRAIETAAEQFDRVENLLRDYAAKMQQAATRIRTEQPTQHTNFRYTRADVANSAINDIENCLRNINFAQIARYAARLEVAENNAEGGK